MTEESNKLKQGEIYTIVGSAGQNIRAVYLGIKYQSLLQSWIYRFIHRLPNLEETPMTSLIRKNGYLLRGHMIAPTPDPVSGKSLHSNFYHPSEDKQDQGKRGKERLRLIQLLEEAGL